MKIKTKKCSKCGEVKPYPDFYKYKPALNGLRSDCKKCADIANKTWCNNNREKVRLAYNHFNTGVSPQLYMEFLNAQNGTCAICGKTVQENKKNLAIDHDHKTMKIRGLLCNRCNLGISYLEENMEILKSAAKYIENPPLISRNIDYKPRKRVSVSEFDQY